MSGILIERRLVRQRLRVLQGIYFAQTFAIVLARVLAYSWIIEELGSKQLPWVFLFQAVPLYLFTFALIGFVDRVGRASLLAAGSTAFGIGTLCVFLGSRLGIPGLSPWFLLFSETSIALFGIHFWLLSSDLLSPEQSKRHYPSLALVGALGAILAGAIVQLLPGPAPQALLPLLLIPSGVVAVLSICLHRWYPYRVGPQDDSREAHTHWSQELHEGLGLLRRSSLLRCLALLTAVITCSGVLIDYLYSVAAENMLDPSELPAFFGGINVVINVVQIGLVLTLGPRIFTTFGLARTLASFPSGGIALTGLALITGSPWPIATLKIFDRIQNYLILNPGVGILQNAFNKARRGRACFVYGGLVKPLAISFTGLMLLLIQSPAAILLVLSVIFFGFFALLERLERAYRDALIANLHDPDSRLINNSIEALAESQNRNIGIELLNFYEQTRDPLFRENILKAAARIGDPRFLPVLLEALDGKHISLKCAAVQALARFPSPEIKARLLTTLRNEDSARVKASILAALARTLEGGVHNAILLEGLEDPSPRVRANAIEAIGMTRDARLIAKLRPYLTSPHPRVRANAIVALSRVDSERPLALASLNELFDSANASHWASALHAAGEVRDPTLKGLVTLAAGSPCPHIHRNAVIALGKYDDLAAVEPLTHLFLVSKETGVPVAHALDRFGESVREALIERLSHLTEDERTQAVRTLEACDLNFPELIEQLQGASSPLLPAVGLDTSPNAPY